MKVREDIPRKTAVLIDKFKPALPWLLAGFSIAWGTASIAVEARMAGELNLGFSLSDQGWQLLVPLLFGALGALILSRQNLNTVGWLMLSTALFAGNPLSPYLANTPATELTLGLWLLLWFDGWSWIPFIFPIFLIPLHFPNGSLPSRRWRWVDRLAAGLWLFLAIISMLAEDIGPVSETWSLPNPIGFVPQSFFGDVFMVFWGIGLMTVIGASVTSLFVRYRSAGPNEQDQIKWILFAGIFFFIAYGASFVLAETTPNYDWGGPLLLFALVLFPATITIAILRHRLYDINLIIRRTVQYAILTGLLALLYFGGVVLLQGIFEGVTGSSDSPLITVVSTLGIAAVFNPLRLRIQDVIERRFYRKKYDAEQALARFSVTARDEVDLDRLTFALLDLVHETMQPESVSLGLRADRSDRKNRK